MTEISEIRDAVLAYQLDSIGGLQIPESYRAVLEGRVLGLWPASISR